MPHPSHSSIQNTTQFEQLSDSFELQHCDVTCTWYRFVEEYADYTVKSKLVYLAINLDKTQYPKPLEVLNLLLPVKCCQTSSVLNYLASAHPGKQVERFSSRDVLTGHLITHSVSMITNMTVS
jgi:hypothetical protein